MLWKLRDDLKSKCSTSFLRDLLEENLMNSRGGKSDVCIIRNRFKTFISLVISFDEKVCISEGLLQS